jgi:hypothetical protein
LSVWHRLAPYAALATFPLAGVVTYLLARSWGKPSPPPLPKLLGAFTILGVAVLSAVLGLQAVMARWHPESVACFGVPALLTVFLGLVTIYVGLTSRDPSPAADDDREWWGRLMGTVSRVVFTWLALTCLCLYGPRMVAWLWRLRDAGSVGPALLAVLSALSAAAGAAGIFGGYGTSAGERPTEARVTRRQSIARALPTVGAKIFVFALLLALGTVIYQGSGLLRSYFDLERQARHYLLPGIGLKQNNVGGDPLKYLGVVAMIVAEAALVVVLAGRLISVNRLSLHAMYRTRLIRTFLGASNPKRRADQFTGFDPADNIPMHHLRRNQFFRDSEIVPKGSHDYSRVARLLEFWRDDSSSFGQYMRDRLDADVRTRDLLAGTQGKAETDANKWSDPTRARAISEKALRHLNNLVCDVDLAAHSPYADWLKDEPAGGARQPCDRQELEIYDACRQLANDGRPHLLNRLILEKHCVDTRGGQTKPLLGRCRPKPLHVVNLALNLVGGSNLAWQHRKAGSFTVSPLHCGFMPQPEGSGEERIVRGGYRPSTLYGRGITLGTAMAISGAAASPNMGYHSSPAVAFLLTLINARLGWWLGNPAEIPPDSDWKKFKAWLARFPDGRERHPDRRTWALPHPRHQLSPVINEALSRTSDSCEYVYLSDGGHFENVGLYEMVRRRCRTIVVVDATCDPNCSFADLGGAIRKVRADLGVPIHMEDVRFHKAFPPDKGKFCAMGTIDYSAVDGWQGADGGGADEGKKEGKREDKREGRIVYIKASIREHLPIEVYNYSRTSEAFPHEPTTDQWFSESQFESYRRLGEACVDRICVDGKARTGAELTLEEFVSCANAHAKVQDVQHPVGDNRGTAGADSGRDGAARDPAPAGQRALAGQSATAAKPESSRTAVRESAPPSRPPAAAMPGLSKELAKGILEAPGDPNPGGPASSAPAESVDQPPPEVKSNPDDPRSSREKKPGKGKKARRK